MGKKCITAELNGKTVSIVNNSEKKEAGNTFVSVKFHNIETPGKGDQNNGKGKNGKPKVVNINDLNNLSPTTKRRLIEIANNRCKKRSHKKRKGCHKNVITVR